MTTSENGIAFIKRAEGFSSQVYGDNGRQAIGYGHDLLPGESFPDVINLQRADDLLRDDLKIRFEPVLDEWVSDNRVTPAQNQYDALIDFAYNLGPEALRTMLSHGWSQVPEQLPRWDHVNGVVNAGIAARRHAELAMWETA
jgi:lysozyme